MYVRCKYWLCGKIKTCILHVISLLGHWYLHFYWLWLVGTLQYTFSRTTLGVSLYRIIIEGTVLLQLLPVTVWHDTFKSQLNLKPNIAHICKLFLLTWFFQYINNWSPTFLQYTNIHTVKNLNFFQTSQFIIQI